MAYELNNEIYEEAFAENKRDEGVAFIKKHLGDLVLTSGYIGACDPFVETKPLPFTHVFPVGKYPVEIAIAVHENGDERVAFARVLFSDDRVVRWALAVSSGQAVDTLEENEFFGYGVDAGTGCFLDTAICEVYDKKTAVDESYFDELFQQMENSYQHTRSWLNFKPSEARPENIVCFSSGWGDGTYPTFIGLNESGETICLVTDFFVVMTKN